MTARELYVCSTNGLRLYVKVVGDRTPELVVPGLPRQEDSLANLTERRTVAFFHPRGRGLSDPIGDYASVGLEQELQDIAAVQEALGIGQCALLGNSYMGGTIAIYAARNPERVTRLVQVCPMNLRRFDYLPRDSSEYREFLRKAQARVHPEDRARLAEAREKGLDRTDPAAFSRLLDRVNLAMRMGDRAQQGLERMRYDSGAYENEWAERVRSWFEAFFRNLGDYDWRPLVRDLNLPTLVIHGSEDGAEQARREWCLRPNARLLVLAGVGHIPDVEAPEVFLPAVETFLQGGWPEGSVEVQS